MKATELATALVAHAAAYLPGDEEPDLEDVSDTVLTLAEHPLGKTALRTALDQINDPATKDLVEALIQRVIADLERDSRSNETKVSVTIQPWQAGSIALTAGSILAAATGTLPLFFALPLGLASFGAAAFTSRERTRTAGHASDLKRKADLAKALL